MKNIKNLITTNIYSLFGIIYFVFLLLNLFVFFNIVHHSNNGGYELFDALYGFVIEYLKYHISFLKISLVLNIFILIETVFQYFNLKVNLKFSNNRIYNFIFYFGLTIGYLPIIFWIFNSVINYFSYL